MTKAIYMQAYNQHPQQKQGTYTSMCDQLQQRLTSRATVA